MNETFFTRALATMSIGIMLIGSVIAMGRSVAHAGAFAGPAEKAATRSARAAQRAPATFDATTAIEPYVEAKERAARIERRERAARRRARTFLWPARGRITSRFGVRVSPVTGASEHHGAVDIACELGSPIRASRSGRVLYGGWMPVFGNAVAIEHTNGWVSFYSHMDRLTVHGGRTVRQGQTIGRCGQTGRATGPHVHFEIRRPGGRSVDPQGLLPGRS